MNLRPTATGPTCWQDRPTTRAVVSVIREDWRTHSSDWRMPGFRVLAVHRVANARHHISNPVVRRLLSPVTRGLERRMRNHYGIELWSTASVGREVFFPHPGGIVIHPDAVIGDRCLVRHGVTIGNGMAFRSELRPTIGCDVHLGAGAVIVGAIVVGDGAHLGPNAVVTSDVPTGATVVAAASRTLRQMVVAPE